MPKVSPSSNQRRRRPLHPMGEKGEDWPNICSEEEEEEPTIRDVLSPVSREKGDCACAWGARKLR